MVNNPTVISGLTTTALTDLVESMGEPGYREKQLRHWIYRSLAASFEEMTDLPAAFRQKLEETARIYSLEPVKEITGRDGTVKTLLKLVDGLTIEAALMSYGEDSDEKRRTVCVSTQVGCAIGCPFCATGKQGLQRNLTAGEITDQALYFARYLKRVGQGSKNGAGGRVSNIVFMGMGEPLANYDALMQAIATLNSPEGFGLGARNITVSTVGLVPRIKRFAREKLQVGLAVSLHASDNKLRDSLVPVNRKYPLEQLMPACREYCRETGRRLSFEYVIFKSVNDSPAQARSLAGLLQGMNCHVNLIPANATGARTFRPPASADVLAFERELRQSGIKTTLRQSRGQDINAGCGQLRSRYFKGMKRDKVRPATGE
jgi:23S rRNA (adenine2503-C2)-methyltransferase